MTHQELTNKIEKACQAANPDLLKLEFGCRLQSTFNEKIYRITEVNEQMGRVYVEGSIELIDPREWKILGREPGLADILFMTQNLEAILSIDSDGQFILWDYDEKRDVERNIFWNLKVCLYGQTDETITFLASLLETK